MKSYKVQLRPDAIADLIAIYDYIAQASGHPEVAWRYMNKLQAKCYTLETAPVRGRNREDIRAGLRILPLDKNAVAAFEVDEKARKVTILNVFYGGRDYELLVSE